MPRPSLPAMLAAGLLLAAPAAAPAYRLPAALGPVTGNPAERLAPLTPDDEVYEPATHCDPTARRCIVAATRWLTRNAEGVSWGSYRCEKWGRGSASLHAENRAIDWHPASRAAAARLIELLLAPDSAGTPHALARRMGIEELIWDCSYWSAGSPQFGKYDYCYDRAGNRRRHLDATAAHLDHVHIGFSKAGARAQTSFWRATLRR